MRVHPASAALRSLARGRGRRQTGTRPPPAARRPGPRGYLHKPFPQSPRTAAASFPHLQRPRCISCLQSSSRAIPRVSGFPEGFADVYGRECWQSRSRSVRTTRRGVGVLLGAQQLPFDRPCARCGLAGDLLVGELELVPLRVRSAGPSAHASRHVRPRPSAGPARCRPARTGLRRRANLRSSVRSLRGLWPSTTAVVSVCGCIRARRPSAFEVVVLGEAARDDVDRALPVLDESGIWPVQKGDDGAGGLAHDLVDPVERVL